MLNAHPLKTLLFRRRQAGRPLTTEEKRAFRLQMQKENLTRLPFVSGILLIVLVMVVITDIGLADIYASKGLFAYFLTLDTLMLGLLLTGFGVSLWMRYTPQAVPGRFLRLFPLVVVFCTIVWAGIVAGIESSQDSHYGTLVLMLFFFAALVHQRTFQFLFNVAAGLTAFGVTATLARANPVELYAMQYYLVPTILMAWLVMHVINRARQNAFLKQRDLETANAKLAQEIQEHDRIKADLEQTKVALEESIHRRNKELAQARNELQEKILHFRESEARRQDLNRQLERSQRMEAVGRLAGGVAHDFNNLLTAIIGAAEVASLRTPEDNPIRKNLDEVLETSMRAADLIRQLLAFSRRQALQPKVMRLEDTVSNLERMLRRIIGEDIDMKLQIGQDLWSVLADPAQIEQVIVNLVVNARDAMANGGKLIIRLQNRTLPPEKVSLDLAPGDYVALSVQDTGIGIADEIRERIFDPFFSTKEEGKGTGLGLATVFGIVRQSKGDLEVTSLPGKGTEFIVYLPRAGEDSVKSQSDVGLEETPSGDETILVVEDEQAVRTMITKTLTRYGYSVAEAKDGLDALALLKQNECKPALLLTDMVMPEMDGVETARRATELCSELRVVLMTGYADDFEKRIVNSGIRHFKKVLRKPFLPRTLCKTVREALDVTLERPLRV